MGRDKAALPFGCVTLLAHQLEKLKALGTDDLMISGRGAPLSDVRLIPDEMPHRGPLSGIHACLKAAKHEAVLFLSVDVPLIPPETLRSLRNAHDGGVTLLSVDGTAQPLIGVYDSALFQAAETLLHGEDSSVRLLFAQTKTRLIPFTGDPSLLLNCNTPEEYEDALHRIEIGLPY